MISFNEIPNYLVPSIYIEEDNSQAVQNGGQQPYKALLIGQSYKVAEDKQPKIINSVDEAVAYYGLGSILSEQIKYFMMNNNYTPLYALALPYKETAKDDYATATLKVVLPTNFEAPSGLLQLMIGGEKIIVNLSDPSFITELARENEPRKTSFDVKKLFMAIEANLTQISPVFSVTSTRDTLKIKTAEKGLIGSYTSIYLIDDSKHEIKNISFELTPFSGSVHMPDTQGLEDKLGSNHFNIVQSAFFDDDTLRTIDNILSDRAKPHIGQDSLCFVVTQNEEQRINSKYICEMYINNTYSNVWSIGASLASVVSFQAQIDPARPFTGYELKGVYAPFDLTGYTFKKRNMLLSNGISTYKTTDSGKLLIERLVTTYTTNSYGAKDTSYLDINIPLTLSFLKWDFKNTFNLKYPRYKLGNDGTNYGAGQKVMTPNLGRAEAIGLYEKWEKMALVEGLDTFKKALIVERSTDSTRLDFRLQPDLINQLMVLGVQMAFIV